MDDYIKWGWVGGGSEPLLGNTSKHTPPLTPIFSVFGCFLMMVLVGDRRSMGRTPKSRSPQRIAHFIPLLGNGMPSLLEPPFGRYNHDDNDIGRSHLWRRQWKEHHLECKEWQVEGTAFVIWSVASLRHKHFSIPNPHLMTLRHRKFDIPKILSP